MATMKSIEVFDGNSLQSMPVPYQVRNPGCAFMGTGPNNTTLYVPLDDDLLSRHMLILGGIGTGKTNAFTQVVKQIVPNLRKDDVMIVFDTKGDFYKELYRKGDIVISNDHTATGPNGPDYWNIFNEIERGERMEETIAEVSKTLFSRKIEKTNQPFFPTAAKDLFAAVLTHLAGKGDNAALRDFMDRSPTSEIREMLKSHPEMAAMVSYISDDRSPQTQGVMSELQQLVREIFIGNFRKSGTLSIRDAVRQKGGRVVFIEYDIGIGKALTPIYSLLFDLAIKEALSRNRSEGNVYFIVDEFSLLPDLQHIDDAVNFGRSLGVKFMIGLQNIDQLYDNYGEYRARNMLSGFLTSVCFRVNDETSREFIKKLHGGNRKKEVYMASVQGRGIVENVRDAMVVEDWDIQRLGLGDAIIGLPGAEPFRFHFRKA